MFWRSCAIRELCFIIHCIILNVNHGIDFLRSYRAFIFEIVDVMTEHSPKFRLLANDDKSFYSMISRTRLSKFAIKDLDCIGLSEGDSAS